MEGVSVLYGAGGKKPISVEILRGCSAKDAVSIIGGFLKTDDVLLAYDDNDFMVQLVDNVSADVLYYFTAKEWAEERGFYISKIKDSTVGSAAAKVRRELGYASFVLITQKVQKKLDIPVREHGTPWSGLLGKSPTVASAPNYCRVLHALWLVKKCGSNNLTGQGPAFSLFERQVERLGKEKRKMVTQKSSRYLFLIIFLPQFPDDLRNLGAHPGTQNQRKKWSESVELARRERAKLPLISELYHIEKIPQILELQLRLYSHGRSFRNSTDDTHADQMANRLVNLIAALETYETRKAAKAQRKEKEQRDREEIVRIERNKEEDTDEEIHMDFFSEIVKSGEVIDVF